MLAIKSDAVTSRIVLECKNVLEELIHRGNTVKLVWVPGHSGIQGNDEADRLV